jgi:hypothetical protein
MSVIRISVPDSILKSFIDDIPEALRTEMPAWILSLDPTTQALDEPMIVPPRSRRRRAPAADPESYSPIEHTLYSVQTFGFTHPSSGRYLMVPKEFQAIMLLETKAVAAVVWEIMQQTIGWEGNGPGGRRE